MRVGPRIMIRLLMALSLVPVDQAAVASSRLPLVQSIDVQIPFAPGSVMIAGQQHLAYELHVTNFHPFDVVLNRVEILDAVRGERIAELTRSQLAGMLGRVGAHVEDDQRSGIQSDAIPDQLRSRLGHSLLTGEIARRVGAFHFESERPAEGRHQPQVVQQGCDREHLCVMRRIPRLRNCFRKEPGPH